MKSAMQEVFHILLKDAWRCRFYAGVVSAITAVLAVLTPLSSPTFDEATRSLNNTVGILQFLLPVTWWFTAAHLVFGEKLVGDRQFWITRPYSWKCLAAAKLLFCAVFLLLPFLLADCVILSKAGFSPAALWPALFWRQCNLAGWLVLPALIIATLTGGIRQFILSILFAAIAAIFLGQLHEVHVYDPVVRALARPAVSDWFEDVAWPIGYAAAAFGLLLWQYRLRQTTYGRAVALLALGCIILWPVTIPDLLAKGVQPFHMADNPEIQVRVLKSLPTRLNRLSDPSNLEFDIPLEVSGRDRQLLNLQVAAYRLERGGEKLSVQAVSTYRPPGADENRGDWLVVRMPHDQFDRVKGDPVTLQVVLGIVLYEKQITVPLASWGDWTAVPGLGFASMRRGPGLVLEFRAPLTDPSVKFIATTRGTSSGSTGRAEWVGNYPELSNFHISPVVSYGTPFLYGGALPEDNPDNITVERPIKLIRRDLRIENLHLAEYAR